MIQPNELRIGNKVFFQGQIIEITGVTKSSIYWGDSNFAPNILDMFEPIPLTEEWLVKFGFKKNETFCFIHINSGLELLNISDKYFRAYYRKATIKADVIYAHQLQNLYFALCGEELQLQ